MKNAQRATKINKVASEKVDAKDRVYESLGALLAITGNKIVDFALKLTLKGGRYWRSLIPTLVYLGCLVPVLLIL